MENMTMKSYTSMMEKMKIKQVFYPRKRVKKFEVYHNSERFTCYLDPICGHIVCTGNGKTRDSQIITDTLLGTMIILECSKRDCLAGL